ncbi:MAG TPA: carbohydrate ABC transporter permease [Bacilli bacterium]|nr:MAG: Trehalose transport system permease protein SugB [Tenericutes bacterium ADurb.BinA124]HNZ50566.1 carbohydrate ABC transporter permease [Bacilli bacterium]HPN61159.1 carbohydrate ABC transporter permease [Bacilli bacterium]HPX84215.1 carbohydrate ABC transporter permease [Bacilli bacterium]HQC74447.1 carbohydrate ABC transporter permease [Bacilli bacterium]
MMNKDNKTLKLGTFKQKMQKMKADFKDPTKVKVRSRRAFMVTGSVLRTFILIGLIFVILLPLFQKFSFALRHPMDITNPQVIWIPETISNINFQIAYQLLDFGHTIWNTLILSTFSMIIQIMATAVAGYAFARLRFKGSNIIFYIVLFTLVVPNETLHIARVLYFSNSTFLGIRLIGNVFSMFIMAAFGMGIRSAIFIYLFRQFFKGLPIELEESAQVDGAGVFRTFWSVMLPNARGAIVTVGLFAFVWQWNDYYFASLFQYSANNFAVFSTKLAGGTDQLYTVLSGWVARGDSFFQDLTDETVRQNTLFYGLVANTAALLMMLPLLIGYFFVQKLFVESIERTGIVG